MGWHRSRLSSMTITWMSLRNDVVCGHRSNQTDEVIYCSRDQADVSLPAPDLPGKQPFKQTRRTNTVSRVLRYTTQTDTRQMHPQPDMFSVQSHTMEWSASPGQSQGLSTFTVPLPTSLDTMFLNTMLNNPPPTTSTTTDITTVIDVSTTTDTISPSSSQTSQIPTATQKDPETSLNTPSGKAALILGILLLVFIVVAVPLFFRSRDKWRKNYGSSLVQHRDQGTDRRGDVELRRVA